MHKPTNYPMAAHLQQGSRTFEGSNDGWRTWLTASQLGILADKEYRSPVARCIRVCTNTTLELGSFISMHALQPEQQSAAVLRSG